MFNKAKNASIQLSSLSKSEIESICKHDPEWMYANAPHMLFSVRPDWCIKFKPQWTFMNYTSDMVSANPVWCCYFFPADMASLDWDKLVEHNLPWALENQLERLLRTKPELVGYYSEGYCKTALTTIKPADSIFSSWNIWSKTKSKGQDVSIPKNIRSVIQAAESSASQPSANVDDPVTAGLERWKNRLTQTQVTT